MPSPLTTHVLDLASGLPAANLTISLFQYVDDRWLGRGKFRTDADGRVRDLLPEGGLNVGSWELRFAVGAYFAAQNTPTFYDEVPIRFVVADSTRHHHVPLLVSPFGYSTYRGS